MELQRMLDPTLGAPIHAGSCGITAPASIGTDGLNVARLVAVSFRNAVKERIKSVILGRNFLFIYFFFWKGLRASKSSAPDVR